MIALLALSVLALGGATDSLYRRYFPDWEHKDWMGTEAVRKSDFFWQPKLLVLLPDAEKNYRDIQSSLKPIREDFGPKGLVTILFTDLSKEQATKMSFGEGELVAVKAQSVLAKCRARKAPIAFLLGLDDMVVWEGNPVDFSGAREEIARQTLQALQVVVPAEVEEKLIAVKEMILRKRLTEADREMKKLGKDKSLAQGIQKLQTAIDQYYATAAVHAKKLMNTDEVYLAFLFWGGNLFRQVENIDRLDPLIELGADWQLEDSTARALHAAGTLYKAEVLIREGKLKAARSALKDFDSSPGKSVLPVRKLVTARLEEVESWL